ncbi:hypothetical protein GCM10010247_29530 [Streptomyces calvus]|nr:hypothetical protein GCM10010247_29530 [Streptomyces calvus]
MWRSGPGSVLRRERARGALPPGATRVQAARVCHARGVGAPVRDAVGAALPCGDGPPPDTVRAQEPACGPGAPDGWDGPAGPAGRRAVGQVVVVRPEFADDPSGARSWEEGAAVLPPAGHRRAGDGRGAGRAAVAPAAGRGTGESGPRAPGALRHVIR